MKTLEIALYSTSFNGDERPLEYAPFWEEAPNAYIRLSSIVTVNFPLLPKEDVVAKQLAEIAKAEQKAREEFQVVLDRFKDARTKLQALPNLSEVNEF